MREKWVNPCLEGAVKIRLDDMMMAIKKRRHAWRAHQCTQSVPRGRV